MRIYDGDRKILTTELLTKSIKKIIVLCCYKPPGGKWKNHFDNLQAVLTNVAMKNKIYFGTEHFNQNCLEFRQSSEIRWFLNNIFEIGAIF